MKEVFLEKDEILNSLAFCASKECMHIFGRLTREIVSSPNYVPIHNKVYIHTMIFLYVQYVAVGDEASCMLVAGDE